MTEDFSSVLQSVYADTEISGTHLRLEIAAPAKQGSAHHWKFYLHTAFNLPYVYDYITKLCRQQAEVIQNNKNEHVRGILV
jgi:hypothetical protein